jgi:hypothetical protein
MALRSDDQASLPELRIEISRGPGPVGEYDLQVTAPDGATARGPFFAPLSEEEIQAVRTASSGVPHIQRSWATQTADFALATGARLFDSVFAGRLGRLYNEAAVLEGGLGLRLISRDRLVMALPWELLYDHEILNDFIALSDYTLARQIPGPEPRPEAAVTEPLRILLVAVDSPYDSVPGARAQAEQLRESIGPNAQVMVFCSADATLENVDRLLAVHHPHVFHYIGPGAMENSSEQGLWFSGSAGEETRYYGSHVFGNILRKASGLRLAFFGAGNTDIVAAAAAANVAAVIGMRGLITDRACMMFATEFYRRVFDRFSLERAVSGTRRRINRENPGSVEWAVPVLYLRDGATLLPSATRREAASVSFDVAAGLLLAADPRHQDELEYLRKKLTVTEANLEELRLRRDQMGESVPSYVTSQIEKLEHEHLETSSRISELRP